ncbi:MAG: YicC family protein [Desulfamplus sp.]|nr:YicC family protein [Desulfamplus sp.]
MIKSMTAYAEASHSENCIRCDVEIRSYNSRHLDIALYLPRSFSRYEDGIKKLISSKLSRGRIEIRIGIEDQSDEAVQFQVDIPRAQAYYRALVELKERLDKVSLDSGFSIKSDISIEQILEGKDMIKSAEKRQDDDLLIWETISKAVDSALDSLEAMRGNEGDNLAKDLMERINYIEDSLLKIESEAASMPQIYRDRLIERVAALIETDNSAKQSVTNIDHIIDPVRLTQEVAILADKSDISEEIVRVKSHISLFRNIINSPEPGGRKLNFLLQEFNREFNTMGSKSGRAELSHIIVDLKSELEKIREQIQNIE